MIVITLGCILMNETRLLMRSRFFYTIYRTESAMISDQRQLYLFPYRLLFNIGGI